MFVPYSSDHCIEFRPWMAYFFYPIIVIGAFAVIGNDGIPEANSMTYFFFDASGLFIVAYIIGTVFALWTFGKAVCAKIGNVLYFSIILVSLALGFGLFEVSGESIWILNWLVHCLAGLFIVFCPTNEVDCFIYVPPFRSVSINGTLVVLLWLVYDLFFCLLLGWMPAVLLHPLSLVTGILLGSILLKIPFVGRDLGDITLWQWIRGVNPDQDLAWKESWSAKRGRLQQEEQAQEQRVEYLKEKEQEFLYQNRREDKINETIDVLCQCGQIVHLSMRGQKEAPACPYCHHLVHFPK
jgi:hypothetical protein